MKKNLHFWNEPSFLFPTVNSVRGVRDLRREVARFFDEVSNFRTGGPPGETERIQFSEPAFIPDCDVEEAETHYLMSFDLPGTRKEDIHVDVHDGIVVVSGERNEEREDLKLNTRECIHGNFRRVFSIPSGIDPKQIGASYESGVLQLAVPKADATEAHRVKIEDGKIKLLNKFSRKKKTLSSQHPVSVA